MLLFKVRRLMAAVFFKAGFLSVVCGLLCYVLISYGLLFYAGEKDLVSSENFFYWLIVTSSTVGYGDLSPTTPMGKLAVSLWVIPVGLSLFALLLTRAGFYLSALTLMGKKGFRMIRIENHCVIIGWNAARTLRLIDLLLSRAGAEREQIVLCVTEEMENPMPGQIDFVHAESFSHHDSMARASLASASRVIIDTPLDDVTLTTALYCDKVSPNSHKTAYFQDDDVGDLLHSHCPNIEIIPSVSVEMLARSSMDPGSALLHKQLLDNTYGMTQYSLAYEGSGALRFEHVFMHFKTKLDATVIGVKRNDSEFIDLNPGMGSEVNPGDFLYYIAASRVDSSRCFDM